MARKGLVKVRVDLPTNGYVEGEWLWAEALGDDLYKIWNIPFYAYGLNLFDVVQTTFSPPALGPAVVDVVRPSGHRTYRVYFAESYPEEHCQPLLQQLVRHRASWERGTKRVFAIDVPPEGDDLRVFHQLDQWEAAEILSFETCEARVDSGFDDVPERRPV